MSATWPQVEDAFRISLEEEGRPGLLAVVPVSAVELLPVQRSYLRAKLAPLGLSESEISAVSIGIAYHPDEIFPIPEVWSGGAVGRERWNDYASAYHELNDCLARVARSLASRFGGVAEGPTREGIVGKVGHVTDYFPTCVSHRAFAEMAGLGWRGRHQLIVTPEFGPALRLATVFLPGRIVAPPRNLSGCGQCNACVDLCPVLDKGLQNPDMNVYREMCRRRIKGLGLDADVCGQCVRRCWEVVARGGGGDGRMESRRLPNQGSWPVP